MNAVPKYVLDSNRQELSHDKDNLDRLWCQRRPHPTYSPAESFKQLSSSVLSLSAPANKEDIFLYGDDTVVLCLMKTVSKAS